MAFRTWCRPPLVQSCHSSWAWGTSCLLRNVSTQWPASTFSEKTDRSANRLRTLLQRITCSSRASRNRRTFACSEAATWVHWHHPKQASCRASRTAGPLCQTSSNPLCPFDNITQASGPAKLVRRFQLPSSICIRLIRPEKILLLAWSRFLLALLRVWLTQVQTCASFESCYWAR